MNVLKNEKGFSLLELVIVIIFFAALIPGVIGYVMNIYKLTKCDFDAPYKAEIIRGAGIPFFPLGVIAGYCTIKDGKSIITE